MRAARSALQIGMILASRHGSLASSKEAKPRERMSTAPPPRPDTYVVDVLSVRGGASRRHSASLVASSVILTGGLPLRGDRQEGRSACACASRAETNVPTGVPRFFSSDMQRG